jgi:magnesium transporter
MKALNALSESFLQTHPLEAALALEGADQKALAHFFGSLAPAAAASVMEHLDPEIAGGCLSRMTPRSAASIVQELSANARIVALRQVSDRRREGVLGALEEQIAEQTRRMLHFSSDSVAALMDTDAITLSADMRIKEAMRRLRRSQRQVDGELYVLSRKHELVGVTTMHTLLKAPPDQLISETMSTECARVSAGTPQHGLVRHPLWVEHNSAAVVDEDNVFLGVVDHRTVARAGERLRSANKDEGGLEAVLALGELYWLGLSGILDGLAGGGMAARKTEDGDHGWRAKDQKTESG